MYIHTYIYVCTRYVHKVHIILRFYIPDNFERANNNDGGVGGGWSGGDGLARAREKEGVSQLILDVGGAFDFSLFCWLIESPIFTFFLSRSPSVVVTVVVTQKQSQ